MVILRLLVKKIEGMRSFQAMQISALVFPPDREAVEMEGRDIYPNYEEFQAFPSVLLMEA